MLCTLCKHLHKRDIHDHHGTFCALAQDSFNIEDKQTHTKMNTILYGNVGNAYISEQMFTPRSPEN